MTDIDPARWWRMNWLKAADNRSAQNKSLKTELHENAVPSPRRPTIPPRYGAVRQDPPIRYESTNDGMLTGAVLGYWAASGSSSSSSSSSSDSSYDSGSSDSGSGGGD
jgi:uncharacterized membrane protein YgcG